MMGEVYQVLAVSSICSPPLKVSCDTPAFGFTPTRLGTAVGLSLALRRVPMVYQSCAD